MSGMTWRSKKSEGGGCLHDYASHVVDLMNFVVGVPEQVLSAQLQSIYSEGVEDAVYATFRYGNGASGYLETNWSDETHRKMSTTIQIFGTKGKIVSDRQECRVYLRQGAEFEKYPVGWSTRYITELQAPVSGFIARRNVQLGQRVAPGTPLMAVVPLDQVWVDANFKEPQLARMRVGQPVTLSADLYGGHVVYHGTVAGFGAGTGAAVRKR